MESNVLIVFLYKYTYINKTKYSVFNLFVVSNAKKTKRSFLLWYNDIFYDTIKFTYILDRDCSGKPKKKSFRRKETTV